MTSLFLLLALALHAAIAAGAAPLLTGLAAHIGARARGQPAPPPLQPARDLARLLRKPALRPETASDLFPILPLVSLGAMGCAVLLVPGFCLGLPTAPLSDLVTVAGLVALSRAAGILGGLEGGQGPAGAASLRAAFLAIFGDAALIALVLAVAIASGDARADAAAAALRARASLSLPLGLALAACLAAAFAGAGAGGEDEMLLDYAGRDLAAFRAAGMLRALLAVSLAGTIFCPFLMAVASAPLTWPLGLAAYAAKLAVGAGALALATAARARLRLFRMPELLGAALLLASLAAVCAAIWGNGGGHGA